MNISLFTRRMSLVLILGFFYSCGTGEINIDGLVANNEFEQALTAVDQQLERNPENTELYYQKSRIQALMARENPPAGRDSLYTEMVATMMAAPSLSPKIDSLKSETWQMEHSDGLDSYDEGEEGYPDAIAHFSNAITVNPERMSSYKALSVAQYNNGDLDGAIQTLDRAKNIDNMDTDVYGNLGFLYLEKGNAVQSAFYYELAGKDVITNKNIAFGLVNAYLAAQQESQAKDLLKELVETYPMDGQLHNVYGTLLFNNASAIVPELGEAYLQNDDGLVANLSVELEGAAEDAEDELQKAYTIDSQNPNFVESLAVFYNNMSGNYFKLMDVATGDAKATYEQRALNLIDFAIDYYQQISALQPQNSTYQTKIQNLRKIKDSRSQ